MTKFRERRHPSPFSGACYSRDITTSARDYGCWKRCPSATQVASQSWPRPAMLRATNSHQFPTRRWLPSDVSWFTGKSCKLTQGRQCTVHVLFRVTGRQPNPPQRGPDQIPNTNYVKVTTPPVPGAITRGVGGWGHFVRSKRHKQKPAHKLT